jgi:hypothetical protein
MVQQVLRKSPRTIVDQLKAHQGLENLESLQVRDMSFWTDGWLG